MRAEDPIPHPEDQIIVKRSSTPENLGPLRGQVWLTIQTHQARQLVRGRDGTADKPPIIGLVGFADRLRLIWQAARNEDPYADWWLIKVHEAIEATGETLRNWQSDMDDLLIRPSAMDISIAESQQPFRMPLQFANPYAYQGAHLLSAYDRLVCRVLTAGHIGLLDDATRRGLIQLGARKIRATFLIPQGYRFLKLDRASVRETTGRSQEARQLMGELPDDVLNGERQAPIAPRKVKFPQGFVSQVELQPESPVSNQNHSEAKNHNR
ncbi:MAG: TIGR03761 family integrating conjugative element protein [Candidatus Thiodiazotropha sp. (ex. Lucinoma kazani)]